MEHSWSLLHSHQQCMKIQEIVTCCGFAFIQIKLFSFFLCDFILTQGFFRSILFTFQISSTFPNLFLLLISNSILSWSKNILGLISILLSLLRLVLCFIAPPHNIFRRTLHMHLKKFLLSLGRLFYKCQNPTPS